MSQIRVALESGEIATCRVIGPLGFNHYIGARTIWVEHNGKQFMAVCRCGAWRKWMAEERVQWLPPRGRQRV